MICGIPRPVRIAAAATLRAMRLRILAVGGFLLECPSHVVLDRQPLPLNGLLKLLSCYRLKLFLRGARFFLLALPLCRDF
jgi:hypothetical protein